MNKRPEWAKRNKGSHPLLSWDTCRLMISMTPAIFVPDFFRILCRMKGTKEIQTQVYFKRKKKVFCKDCICNAILTVVNQDYALTTGQFAGLDFANHTFHRGLPKKVESLQ